MMNYEVEMYSHYDYHHFSVPKEIFRFCLCCVFPFVLTGHQNVANGLPINMTIILSQNH